MKTKEIEVWVHPQFDEHWFKPMNDSSGETNTIVKGKQPFDYWHKAMIIIHIPEKSVKISESDFDKAVKETDKYFRANTGDTRWVDDLKLKLFGEKS